MARIKTGLRAKAQRAYFQLSKLFSALSDRDIRARLYARGLERTEAFIQKKDLSALYCSLASVRSENLAQKKAQPVLNASECCGLYQELIKAHSKFEQSEHLGVFVTVGQGPKAHVHVFYSDYDTQNEKMTVTFLDPESFIGKRDKQSPEISQFLRMELDADGAYALSFVRMSVSRDEDREFRKMNNLSDIAKYYHEHGDITSIDRHGHKTNFSGHCYYALREQNGLPMPGLSDKNKHDYHRVSHHLSHRLNQRARDAQITRVLGHMLKIIDSGHLRPYTPNRPASLHRHCEPGATCNTAPRAAK